MYRLKAFKSQLSAIGARVTFRHSAQGVRLFDVVFVMEEGEFLTHFDFINELLNMAKVKTVRLLNDQTR